jgi:hypothetical protein
MTGEGEVAFHPGCQRPCGPDSRCKGALSNPGLRDKILSKIDKDADSVRFYPLCNTCSGKIEYRGAGSISDPVFYDIAMFVEGNI